MGELLGGGKGYVGLPLKLLGGAAPPPPRPPTPSSYAYATPLLSCRGKSQDAQGKSRLNATPLLSSRWWSTQLLPGTHTLPETLSSLKQSSAEQPGLSLVTTRLQAVLAR